MINQSNPEPDADQSLEAQPSPPEGDLHLRFYLPSGEELALPATGIREVLSPAPERITPMPNTSPRLLGVLNLRGQAIWVVDGGQLLGDLTPLNTDRAELSVVAIEDQDVIVGLAVEGIIGMDWLNLDQIHPCTAAPITMAAFLRGEWRQDPKPPLRLLNPTAMIRLGRWAA